MTERSNASPIERRLRSQAAAARVQPAPDLERRVLAALDATPAPRAARRAIPPRPAAPARPATPAPPAPAYLAAAGLVLLVGALAVTLRAPRTPVPPTAPSPVVKTHAAQRGMEIVIGIDTTRYETLVEQRAGHLMTAFESPLFDQARRMVADARHAVGAVLARVPAPVRIETGRRSSRTPEGIRESGPGSIGDRGG